MQLQEDSAILSEGFSITCQCPADRTERVTFRLEPVDDKGDDWTRQKPRAYRKVPAVHHGWTDPSTGDSWGVYHVV